MPKTTRPPAPLRRSAQGLLASILPRVVSLSSLLALIVLPTSGLAQSQAGEPVPLIFDTDMGNDVDDAMALSMIHALESRGECKLLAVTLTKDNEYAVRFVDLLNTFYGRGDVPIGVVSGGVLPGEGKYIKKVASAGDDGKLRYPHDLVSRGQPYEAVALLRKVLAGEPDGSVVMVQVGFSTNLAALLRSPPDETCPLDGKALVERKVRLLSAMAGAYADRVKRKREFNVARDVPSARTVFHQWPTPIVASGWEIGDCIKHPARSMQDDYGYVAHHPLREAYGYYRGLANDQPTYDLTSVLYAVRPDRGYFDLSPPGRIEVEDDGVTRFVLDPDGVHRHLMVRPDQIVRVRESQALLCSQPPGES
jgi:inosine-uridine nucleoside N-ribohydrolase